MQSCSTWRCRWGSKINFFTLLTFGGKSQVCVIPGKEQVKSERVSRKWRNGDRAVRSGEDGASGGSTEESIRDRELAKEGETEEEGMEGRDGTLCNYDTRLRKIHMHKKIYPSAGSFQSAIWPLYSLARSPTWELNVSFKMIQQPKNIIMKALCGNEIMVSHIWQSSSLSSFHE